MLLEVIVPSGKAFDTLERHYKRLLKQILTLPSTAADPAIYLLSGMLPIEAVLHKRILSLVGNITRLPEDSVELRLAKHQLEVKSFSSHSWCIVVKKILMNKILTGTCILQTNRVKFNQNEVNPTCQLCNSASETLQHFIIDCKFLESVRDPVLFDTKKVIKVLLDICPVTARYSLPQLIIDSGVVLEKCSVRDSKQLSA